MKIYRFRLGQPPITPEDLVKTRRLISRAVILLVVTVVICVFAIGGDSGILVAGFLAVVIVFFLHHTRGLHDAETSQEDKLASMREVDLIDEAHLGFIQQVAQLNRRLTYGEAEGLIASARAAEMKRRRDSLYESTRDKR